MRKLFTVLKSRWLTQAAMILSGLALISFIGILSCNWWVSGYATYTYNDVEEVPSNRVGLLLGTSKYLQSGYVNHYYKYRIDAAVALYNAKKVEYILISGDNGSVHYDEPTMMKQDLIENGVPENRIYLDYAGFRTYDSMVRAKEIFGQTKITVISQQFHNERAIAIAKHIGIDAIGFNAQDVSARYGRNTRLREYLARTKMAFDLLIGADPKFLGEQIVIR